ncbi:MAG: hypothetical protein ACRCRZ_00770 [Metamycoplasmataceae bacterium]
MRKKMVLSSLIALAIISSITTIYLTSALATNSINLKEKENISSKSIGSQNEIYDAQNALTKDVEQKSKTDSILIYFMNWPSIFHRFGSVSHLTKILEENPNKEIYFFQRPSMKFSLKEFENFQNFHSYTVEGDMLINNIFSIENQKFFPNDLKQIIDEANKNGRKIDFYSDDYLMLKPITTILHNLEGDYFLPKQWNDIIKNLFNEFSILKKVSSINMFADGDASMEFFSNEVYDGFLFANNILDSNGKYISTTKYNDKTNETVNSIEDLLLFLLSFVVNSEKGHDSQKTKYFLPTIQMVEEANWKESTILNTNENDYFNPFNSLEADFISFCRTLSPESMDLIYAAFAIDKPNVEMIDNEIMKDHVNYIYNGRRLFDEKADEEQIVIDEVDKLLNIKAKADEIGHPFNIIFKGHPRDQDADLIQARLSQEIKKRNSDDDCSWLKVIDPKIPYEIYLINGVFENNPTLNKVVKIFAGWSTINLFLYADDPTLEKIEKIYISSSEDEKRNYFYSNKSKIFPEDKIERTGK